VRSRERAQRLLRWYPPAWRRRYGEEFVALIEDTSGDSAPSVRIRLDVVRSGVVTRLREVGLTGDGTPPSEWVRAGLLTVLCAWSIFVVAGIGLQKTAEHWQDSVPAGTARTWATIAFATVQVLAGIASVLVVLGALALVPSMIRYMGDGGWPEIRRPFRRAAVACAVTAVAFAGLVGWAHHLSPPQRNGADLAYGLSALLVAMLVAASIAAITAAGVAAVRRLPLPTTMLRIEGYLAGAVTAAMAAMAIAAGVWWIATARSASWFFGGTASRPASAIDPRMVMVVGSMLVAVALALFGTRRAAQGRRRSA
jgi:hypothetical protein